ncbi:MAG: GyrI-like domain-containing protein [Gemmatimonadota bacterium]|jgi:effector-binding domain-containing protein
MIEAPNVTQTAARLTAVIHVTIPREEIRNVMGPGIGELMTVIADQGIDPAGPWFTHHFGMDPEVFDFEIGVPVAAPVTASGRVRTSDWPAMKVARAVHHGTYEGLGAAWRELDAWIDAQGLTPAPDLWECYVTGPDSNADPASWRTELNRPLID